MGLPSVLSEDSKGRRDAWNPVVFSKGVGIGARWVSASSVLPTIFLASFEPHLKALWVSCLSKGNFTCIKYQMTVFFLSLLTISDYPCCCCLVAESFPTLCNPMDYRPPASSVHGISQARILEWVTFSQGFSQPRYRTCVSCITGKFFATEPSEKPQNIHTALINYFVFYLKPH